MTRWRLLVAGLTGLCASVIATAPGQAAPPARGVIVEGRSVAGVPLEAPVSTVRRAWSLQCGGRLGAGELFGQCSGVREADGTRYLVTVRYDRLGRVVEIATGDPGWSTPRGIGPGGSVAQLRAAYGSGVRIRVTRTWTYAELTRDRRAGAALYRTSFIASTHTKRIVTVIVSKAHEMALTASRPPGGGLVVTVRGGWPRMRLPLEVNLPWSAGEDLGTARLDRRGRGTLVVPPGGALDTLIAERPAKVADPVRVVVTAGLSTTSLVRHRRFIRTTVLVPLPAAPTLSLSPQPVGADGAAGLTVSGAEAGGAYELWARWLCADGRAVQSDVAPSFPRLGAGPQSIPVDLGGAASDRFAASCAGDTPPATLDATLELRRVISRGSRTEVAATLPIVLSAPG